MSMGLNTPPEEIIKQPNRLGSIEGLARQANKKLTHALKAAKKAGRIWEWRVVGIRDELY